VFDVDHSGFLVLGAAVRLFAGESIACMLRQADVAHSRFRFWDAKLFRKFRKPCLFPLVVLGSNVKTVRQGRKKFGWRCTHMVFDAKHAEKVVDLQSRFFSSTKSTLNK
jgi:hypothetical protein